MSGIHEIRGHQPPHSIKRELLQIADNLLPGLTGSFEITQKSWEEYERGYYIRIYASPSKRMKASLGVDREVLILISNFPDQQPRIVELALRILRTESIRLEPTIVILVHNEEGGDEKLRGWGREMGLSVLPVRSEQGQAATPEGIERVLCHSLFNQDPFDRSGPVIEDAHFFGRRDEAIELARQLHAGQVRSCFGLRKVGKTSFVSRAARVFKENNGGACVFVDCARDDIWGMNSGQMLKAVAKAAGEATNSKELYSIPRGTTTSQSAAISAQGLIEVLNSAKRPVLIVFDELDYITPDSPEGKHWRREFNPLWRSMRVVYQELTRGGGSKMSILVSGVSSKWFTVESIDNVENAGLHFVPEEYLGAFDRKATTAMIRKISPRAGLRFSEDAADYVADVCSDFPFFTRKACSYIHKRIPIGGRPLEVERSDVITLMDEYISTEGFALGELAFTHLFRVYPDLEQGSAMILEGNSSALSKRVVSTLVKYGLIRQSSPGEISGRILKEGLKSYLEMRGDGVRASSGKPVVNWNDEMLEELAVINKRRNRLEMKMRELAITVIRMKIQGRKELSVKDEFLKCIAEKRRQELQGLPADSLVDKLYWQELCQVIEKNWVDFQNVFVDAREFRENGKLINERPDAHAKRVDPADVALHRRALDWLEDKVFAK